VVIPTGQSIPAAVHMKNRPTISNCCRDTLTCRDHHVVNPCFLYSGEILPCTFGSLRAIVCTLLSLYPAFSQCRSNGRYFLVLQRAVIGVRGRTTNDGRTRSGSESQCERLEWTGCILLRQTPPPSGRGSPSRNKNAADRTISVVVQDTLGPNIA